MPRLRIPSLSVCLLWRLTLMSLLTASANAGTYNWAGGTQDWTTPAGWATSIVPGIGDIAQIASGTPTISSSVSVGDLLLSGGGLAGSGTLTLVGTGSQWSGGSMNRAGSLEVASGAALALTTGSAKDFSSHAILNRGTVNWSGGAIRSGQGGSFANAAGAFFNDQNTANNSVYSYFGGSFVFTNLGTYDKTGGVITEFSTTFNNQNLVKIRAGELRLSGGGTLTSGAVFDNAGTVTFANDYTVTDAASLQGTGLYQLLGGTLTLNGTLSVPTFNHSGGSLVGSQTFTQTVNWTGGGWNAAAAGPTTTIGPTATLNLSGYVAKDFNYRSLTNQGSVNWHEGALRSGQGGSFTNAAGAFFYDKNTANNSVYSYFGGSFVFTNLGTYDKTGGVITEFSTTFNNQNLVKIRAGELRLSGGGTLASGAVFDNAGTVTFANDYTVTDAASLQGTGLYQLLGGTLTLNGTLAVPTFNHSGGSLVGSQTFTQTVNWTSGGWNAAAAGPTTTIGPTATLNLSGYVAKDFNYRAITNQGTVNWHEGALRSGQGGSFTNAAGAFFYDKNTANNSVYSYFGGSFVFTNLGTYDKTGNVTTEFSTTFNNQNLVKIRAGELRLSGGGTLASGAVFDNAGTVTFANDYTVTDATSLQGTGLYQLLGGTLTLSGTLAVPTFNHSGGSLVGSQTFTQTVNWTGGGWNAAAAGPTTTIGPTATLNLSGYVAKDFNYRSLTNQGTVNWHEGALRSGQGGSFTNAAGAFFYDKNTANNSVYSYFGGSFVFTNLGTYDKTGSVTTEFSTTFNNQNLVKIRGGELRLSGGGTLSSGAVFDNAGTVTFANDYTVTDAASLQGPGLYQLLGGTLTLNGTLAVPTFNHSGGSLVGSQTFTQTVNWTGGGWNAAAAGPTTTIGPTATLNLSGYVAKDFNYRSLTNQGSVNWHEGALRSGQGGSFTNAAGAFFYDKNTANNSVYSYFGGSFVFTNLGTYDKTGSVTTEFNTTFNNQNLVKIRAGELRLSGGGTLASGAVFDNAGTVTFANDYTVTDAASLQGTGLYQLLGGTLMLNGTLAVPTFNQTGGLLTGTQLFGSGLFTWSGGSWNATATGPVTTVSGTAMLDIVGAYSHDFDYRTIFNQGTVNWSGGALRSGHGGGFNNAYGTLFRDQNTGNNSIYAYFGGSMSFTNHGTYLKSGSGTTQIDVPFTNRGQILINAGQLNFTSTLDTLGGSLALHNGATATLTGPIDFGSGTLLGSGTINAPGGLSAGGQISPENLTVNGNFTAQSTAVFAFTLKGTGTPGVDYGLLSISGSATLGGTLNVNFGNGFGSTVSATDTFTLLTAGSPVSGSFSNVIGGARLLTSDGVGSFVVHYGAGSPYGTSSLVLVDFQPIPEPQTWLMLSGGLLVMAFLRRRRF